MLLPSPPEITELTKEATRARETAPAFARFLPSLTDIAFVMPILFLFVKLNGARTLLGDGDTGWHIRTGEWILAHHRVPHTDIFSFTRAGAPWFAWEWLCDALFGTLHLRWGMAAVVLFSILTICLTSVALFRLIRRKCNNGLVAIAVTLLATGGCAIHWLARPHLFTLLFSVITLHVTERAAKGRTKLLAWLVPLTLVWTNLHGGFFVVFLILACYIGSDLLNAAIESNRRLRLDYLRATKPWIAAAAGCLAVTFINPYGFELHRHVIGYITDSYQMRHIAEFQAMNFQSPAAVYYEPLMILALLTVFTDARKRRLADCFLSLGWLHLALLAQRNIPLFAIAASPIVARGIVTAADGLREANLAGWITRIGSRFGAFSVSFEKTDRLRRFHLASAVPFLFIAALLFAPKPAGARFTSTFDPTAFPERALPAVAGPEARRIFTTDQWGDYLIYRLYPSKRVFIDGRSDFYGDKFGEQYLDLLNVKYGWEKVLDKYEIDTILLSPALPLATTIKSSREWQVVYDDGASIVFRGAASGDSRITGSLASSNEGKIRDRAITKATTRDREITQPATQQEDTNQ